MGFDMSDERMYRRSRRNEGVLVVDLRALTRGPHRPVLGRLVQDIKDGLIDVVVIWRSDRLYRSVGVADELLNMMVKYNVRLVASRHDYHIHTATGLANAKQEAVRNEEMVGKTSEDIIRDLQFKKALGQITRSPACLGFRSAGNDSLTAMSHSRRGRARAADIPHVRLRGGPTEGPLCRHAIARQARKRRYKISPPQAGGQGGVPRIPSMAIESSIRCRHVAYIGKMRHAGEAYDCEHLLVPAADGSERKVTVISLALWQRVQDKIDRETKADKRSGKSAAEVNTPHLLTGTVVCGICGRNCYCQGSKREGVQVTPFKFICINRNGETGAHGASTAGRRRKTLSRSGS